MIGLTPRQADTFAFVEAYCAKHGTAPTVLEIAEGIGIGAKSKSRVSELLTALEERGYIRRIPNKARAIEIVGSAEKHLANILADIRAYGWVDRMNESVEAARQYVERRQ